MNRENNDILKLFSVNVDKAFQQLFDLYYAPLVAIAWKYTRDPDAAEDLVQKLLIKFWEEKLYKHINGSLKHYLSVALKNSCLNYLEKEKTKNNRLNRSVIEEEVAEAFDFLLDKEQHIVFEKAINDLPQQSRRSVELVYFSGESYKGAAEKLNVSVNTIKSHLKAALRKLKANPNILNYYKDQKN